MKHLVLVFLLTFLVSCTDKPDPLNTIVANNNHYPEITIELADIDPDAEKMKFKITVGKPMDAKNPKKLTFSTTETGWTEVSSKFYNKYLSDLGMVIYTKRGNIHNATPQPRGYDRVGNPQYGSWKTDSRGISFWEFYGMYAFMSHMSTPIYRNDYNSYRTYRNSGRPYYGSKGQYGTGGTVTSKGNSTFNNKFKNRSTAKKQAFKNKVQSRKSSRTFSTRASRTGGRSSSGMSGTRGGSGRGGK